MDTVAPDVGPASPRRVRIRRVAIAIAAVLAVIGTALVVMDLGAGSPPVGAPAGATFPSTVAVVPGRPSPAGPSRGPATAAQPPASAAPSPSPSNRPSSTTAPTTPATTSAAPTSAAPTVAASAKKGVSVWTFNGVDKALTQSGARWYYTWSTTHNGVRTPAGVDFVPMIWGSASVTTANLHQAAAAGHYLLGFNEPDLGSQSNMTVEAALALWPQLMATGLSLGSPAVASGGATAGGWLDRFMSGAKSHGYRVDFITLHWYGGDFTTADAVAQLRAYLQAVYDRYHKPIWLTEYALTDFSHGTRYPSEAQQAAFVTASTRMLAGLSFLKRYAWFALPASDTGPSTGLFRSGPVATAVGRAFEAAG